MSPSKAPSPALPAATALTTLITHCRASLTTSTSPTPLDTPLPILLDTATLIKSHTTRLSVALRPPITPDAATKFLSDLTSTVIPSFTAAASALNEAQHGTVLVKAARRDADAVLAALEEFITSATNVEDKEKEGKRLVDTGIVWSAVDRLVGLCQGGQAGAVEQVLGSCAEIVKDAEGELREWVEEYKDNSKDDDEEEEEEEDEEDGGFSDDEDDEGWGGENQGKVDFDEATLKRAEQSLKRIKLVTILFTAARKRRLGPVGAEGRIEKDVKRIDEIAERGRELEKLVDDLGMSFYEDEVEESTKLLREVEKKVAALAGVLAEKDGGGEDKFTAWFRNCEKAALTPAA